MLKNNKGPGHLRLGEPSCVKRTHVKDYEQNLGTVICRVLSVPFPTARREGWSPHQRKRIPATPDSLRATAADGG